MQNLNWKSSLGDFHMFLHHDSIYVCTLLEERANTIKVLVHSGLMVGSQCPTHMLRTETPYTLSRDSVYSLEPMSSREVENLKCARNYFPSVFDQMDNRYEKA